MLISLWPVACAIHAMVYTCVADTLFSDNVTELVKQHCQLLYL